MIQNILLMAVAVSGALLCPATAAPIQIDPGLAQAVFQYQFNHNESAQQSAVAIYCIGYVLADVDEHDPPGEVLARFSDSRPRVEPFSRCPCNQGSASDLSWIMFRINAVKCSTELSCEVEGGYYEHPESASGNTYYLEKQNGRWVVTRNVMHWIS